MRENIKSHLKLKKRSGLKEIKKKKRKTVLKTNPKKIKKDYHKISTGKTMAITVSENIH